MARSSGQLSLRLVPKNEKRGKINSEKRGKSFSANMKAKLFLDKNRGYPALYMLISRQASLEGVLQTVQKLANRNQ